MKKLIYLLLLTMFSGALHSQDFNLKWSEKMQYDNYKDGFFNKFLGSSDQYVYGLHKNLALRPKKADKQLKLIAFDKTTMKKVASFSLKNGKDKARTASLKDLEYHETIVLKDIVYVFWKKSTKNKVEVYAEAFDAQLDRKDKLKKVFTANYPEVKKTSFAKAPLVILSGKDGSDDLLIGTEIPNGKGETIDFNYITIDADLTEIVKGKFSLPVVQTGKFSGISSKYTYGKDGNLYIQSFVRMSKEERKTAKKGEYTSYSILSVVDLADSEINSFDMKYENINIFNFSFEIDKDKVHIYGFFNDMKKDPSGLRTHGIFSTTIDSKTNQMADPNFSHFDKKTLAELFKNDKEDKKTTSGSKKKKAKAKGMDEEALDESYVIEVAKIVDKDHIVLFCSKMYNYSVTTCTSSPNGGGQTCTTRYYCQKSNVTAFKLNTKGEIVWASNIDRLKTYNGTSVDDLRVVSDKDNFYVIYGSSFRSDAATKNRKSSKNKSEVRDQFEYAIFDAESGKNKKADFIVNKKDVKKSDRKSVDPVAITVIDNQYFINSSKVKMKPGLTVAGCAASVVCFPVLYYVFMSGDMRKGTGHIGTLEVIK